MSPASDPPERKLPLKHRLRWWVLFLITVAYLIIASALLEPLAGNVLLHVVVFAVLLALFHILFICAFPFTARDWKAVDYIWLAFGGLGIIGVSGESRRMKADWEQTYAHVQATNVFEQLKNSVESDTTYFCKEQWRPSVSDTVILPVMRDFPRACVWFRQLAEVLPESLGAKLPDRLDNGVPAPPAIDDAIVRPDIEYTKVLLNDYRHERGRYLNAVAAREETSLEIILKLGSGLLLVFALALRITKVTGEILATPPHTFAAKVHMKRPDE
jgi:hypothetical protein